VKKKRKKKRTGITGKRGKRPIHHIKPCGGGDTDGWEVKEEASWEEERKVASSE